MLDARTLPVNGRGPLISPCRRRLVRVLALRHVATNHGERGASALGHDSISSASLG